MKRVAMSINEGQTDVCPAELLAARRRAELMAPVSQVSSSRPGAKLRRLADLHFGRNSQNGCEPSVVESGALVEQASQHKGCICAVDVQKKKDTLVEVDRLFNVSSFDKFRKPTEIRSFGRYPVLQARSEHSHNGVGNAIVITDHKLQIMAQAIHTLGQKS